jgi:hypothetical protein
MATKRTKADKARRQADRLEKRTEARLEQVPRKRPPHEDFGQAVAAVTERQKGRGKPEIRESEIQFASNVEVAAVIAHLPSCLS